MENTPRYEIDFGKYKENCLDVMNSFSKAWCNTMYGYSVKTNRNPEMIKYANGKLGWLIETVSPDEYNHVLNLGIKPEEIILNGPNKESVLVQACLSGTIVIIDNLTELEFLCSQVNKDIASQVSVGLRVNFDLEKMCPSETTAGESPSRFGICYENGDLGYAIEKLMQHNVSLMGLHTHISTKTRSLNVFASIAKTIATIVEEYKLKPQFVDLGGGFFGGQVIPGKPTMKEYAEAIAGQLQRTIDPVTTKLIIEPGASTIATAVKYITSVVSIRKIRDTTFVTLDGSLLHINPFLAKRAPVYRIFSKNQSLNRKVICKQVICGSTCMENDRFMVLEDEVALQRGDIIEFYNTGAYTMAFNSNFILPIPSIRYCNDNLDSGC